MTGVDLEAYRRDPDGVYELYFAREALRGSSAKERAGLPNWAAANQISRSRHADGLKSLRPAD